MPSKPLTWKAWLRAAIKDPACPIDLPRVRYPLAPLTGQDTRALNAFVACLELYASGDEDAMRGGLAAMRAILPALQRSCWPFARELIPFVFDWPDRARLWPLIAGSAEADTCGGDFRFRRWPPNGTPPNARDLSYAIAEDRKCPVCGCELWRIDETRSICAATHVSTVTGEPKDDRPVERAE